MFDLMQNLSARQVVKAHGREWLVLYDVPGARGQDGVIRRIYLAVPLDSEDFPNPVTAIMIECNCEPIRREIGKAQPDQLVDGHEPDCVATNESEAPYGGEDRR